MAEHGENMRTRDNTVKGTSAEWWQEIGNVIVTAVKDLFRDDGPQWAAAIAYYALLSSFPLVLAIVAIAAFFIDNPQTVVDQIMRWLGEFVPQGQTQFIEDNITGAIQARGSVGLVSILALLWTGSRVFGALTKALNMAFDVDETYGFFKRILVEVIMLLTVGALFIIAIAAGPILNFLSNSLQVLPLNQGFVFTLLIDVVPAFLLFLSFFLIYLYVPRRRVDWEAALPGAVLATALFLIARPLFTTYVRNFGNYNLIYGSLAVVVILVLWTWISALILLFGGEVAAHIQDIMIEGQTAERVEQRHKERSPTNPKS